MAYVTLASCAGADDQNDPAEIAWLGKLYPVMEVAVQLSKSRAGTPVYPTLNWLARFAEEAAAVRCRAALHVNGSWGREACQGMLAPEVRALLEMTDDMENPVFRRVQINFDAERDGISPEGVVALAREMPRQRLILQHNAANAALLYDLAARGLHYDILFDASRGTGAIPAVWPKQVTGKFCAFAGGLSPETLPVFLHTVGEQQPVDFGVDAESGLRTPGDKTRFEVTRAAAFAAAAASWNGRPSPAEEPAFQIAS
jgi:hypothetical protein